MTLEQFRLLASELSRTECLVVVTGAGLSSESGLPMASEFLDTPRSEHCPEFSTYKSFISDPVAAWRFYDDARCRIASARPSPAHVALVELERLVSTFVLATHNIDRLHQIAGNTNVLELSGNIWTLRCEADGFLEKNYSVPLTTLPPLCKCGSIFRPDV